MLKIGITGGIGSGKTTVAKIFESLGVPVYYADDAGKRLMQENIALREAIQTAFGAETYNTPDGSLNRAYLAKVVFSDIIKLRTLEALVHPVVAADTEKWVLSQRANTAYVLKEAALMFESGAYLQLDKIIVVYAPEQVRIGRVMARDKSSEGDVRARMAKQWPDEEKLKRGDFVIYNDGQQLIIPQILSLHTQLNLLAAQK